MIKPIKVVDSIMGSGKTSAAINLINSEPDTNFIYITPYLDEVKRIKSSTNRNFYSPEYYQNNIQVNIIRIINYTIVSSIPYTLYYQKKRTLFLLMRYLNEQTERQGNSYTMVIIH